MTLVIPTAFVSWTGEALDKKTPLLRSMEALSTQAVRVLKLFGSDATRVTATCGPEQEYFLIDRNFYFARPDLINAGRTLFGARPPKGQELEDQYFGSIPERVLACMAEVEAELYKVGVPVKTRHNEVAPSQYEIAPIFESANVATDHQMMTMETLKRMAPKYGLACLLHEKPFAGVNGSGKHLNWSIGDDRGNNLLNPGETPHDNMQFLFFCMAVIRAVDKWQGLLRMSIASAGNDHRLGANEAPPAILSVFLGDMLTDIFDQLEGGGAQDVEAGRRARHRRRRCCRSCRATPAIATARRRLPSPATSSSSARCRRVRTSRSRRPASTSRSPSRSTTWRPSSKGCVAKGQGLEDARRRRCCKKLIKQHKRIIFNGNNYSAEWQKEAGKRGLLNLKNTVDALPEIVKPDVVKTFEKFKVLNERELHARYEVNLETYCKTINVEAQLMVLMANRYILPAALEYQRRVGRERRGGQSRRASRARKARSSSTASSSSSISSRRRPTSWPTRSSTRARRPRSTRSTCATRSCR